MYSGSKCLFICIINRQEPLEKRKVTEAQRYLQRQNDFVKKNVKPSVTDTSKTPTRSTKAAVLKLTPNNKKPVRVVKQPQQQSYSTPPATPRSNSKANVSSTANSPRRVSSSVVNSPRGHSPNSIMSNMHRSASAQSVHSLPDLYRYRPQSFPPSPPSPRIVDNSYVATPRPRCSIKCAMAMFFVVQFRKCKCSWWDHVLFCLCAYSTAGQATNVPYDAIWLQKHRQAAEQRLPPISAQAM